MSGTPFSNVNKHTVNGPWGPEKYKMSPNKINNKKLLTLMLGQIWNGQDYKVIWLIQLFIQLYIFAIEE